jgi:phytoene dehydrogenase-like protein
VAILLASAGLRVKLIERLRVAGGRTSAIAAGGCKFDLGPMFLLFPRVLEEIFATAGANYGVRWRWCGWTLFSLVALGTVMASPPKQLSDFVLSDQN